MDVTIEDIEVSSLHVDPAYQRALGEIHVERLVEHFNPAALGEIDISERSNGDRYIVDGHHRWIACRRVGHQQIKARIHRGLTFAEEATLFLALNFSKSVSPGQKYNARVLVGEPQVLEIKAAVEAEGLTINPAASSTDGTVAAISKLDQIYTHWGVGAISQVLQVINIAWPTEGKAREAAILGGIARFLVVFPNTSLKDLGKKLGQATVQEITQSRRAYKRDYGITTDAACARAVWRQYNRGRKGNKLPNLFDR